MDVLVGCETSGVVREAFRSLGHNAWSCDVLPADDGSEFHFQCDVRDVLGDRWDLGIFHPPCTRLCNSGVCWLEKRNLWDAMRAGADLFRDCLNAPIPCVAVENPIPHKYALERIGSSYNQIIHPWMFGHGESKATCLWLRNLPPLFSTKLMQGRHQRLHRLPPSESRWKERSKTYQGIADAMAAQWSV